LRNQLNNEKILLSQITSTKETENSNLNKFLNDTINLKNNKIIEVENKYEIL
jgi:hypothetical protein